MVFVSFFSRGVKQHAEKVNQTGQAEEERGARLTAEFSFSFSISFCCLGLAKPKTFIFQRKRHFRCLFISEKKEPSTAELPPLLMTLLITSIKRNHIFD